MNVNFEPIIRGLKSDNLKCKIRFIYVGFNFKRKKRGVKKCLEICAIKGGRGGLTPNNKYHLKFLFWLLAPVPYALWNWFISAIWQFKYLTCFDIFLCWWCNQISCKFSTQTIPFHYCIVFQQTGFLYPANLNINQLKLKLQNLIWASTSKPWPTATAAKYWLNFSFKIFLELQHQNLDHTLFSKSGQKFDFLTKLQLPNLHQTIVIRISTKNKLHNLNQGSAQNSY